VKPKREREEVPTTELTYERQHIQQATITITTTIDLMMSSDNKSRSGGRFHRYDFDEMDAFDPIAVKEELRRQAQYVSNDKKINFMLKRRLFKADGIPKTIQVEIETEDSKSSSAFTIAVSCTDNTAASSLRSSSDSQLELDESLAVNPLSHTSKYVDLPRDSRNKSRAHSRTPERRQRPPSQAINHETRGASDKTSHLDHLFAGREDPPKAQSHQHRSTPNIYRPLRRVNSVDRGAHLNSLFSPSGPKLPIPLMNRSHSTRR
jgi:hypothetical protein